MLEEETREMDESDIGEFDTLDSSEKTIAIRGDILWPQAAKQEGDTILIYIYGNDVLSAQALEVSLLGAGTVLRLERDA